jgi:hypothetical protein
MLARVSFVMSDEDESLQLVLYVYPQVNPTNNTTSSPAEMSHKMNPVSKDACDLNYHESVHGQVIFPVSNGIILQTFKLEHNAPTTNISFDLREEMYNTLINK